MGGGERGTRISYAATRAGAQAAFSRDREKPLSEYSSTIKPRAFISFHIDDESPVN